MSRSDPEFAEELPSEEDIAMFYLADRLARMETDADRREFLKGVMGTDSLNVRSLAAGWIATSILLKGRL